MLLRRLARGLVNKFLQRRLPRPFHQIGEFEWAAALPRFRHASDRPDAPLHSSLAVYENGLPLVFPHSIHDDIRTRGQGRYSHWGDRVIFSTTDNSDPNTNGRTYEYSVSAWLYRRRVPEAAGGSLPVNHRKRDDSAGQIEADVEYAVRIGKIYLEAIRRRMGSLEGLRVLEIGPGVNYGSILYLAAYGAQPFVADRFLAPWDEAYHARFYRRLTDAVAKDPAADVGLLRRLVAGNGYDDCALTRYESALENIPTSDASIDVVFSNAVAEHFYDVAASFAQMYRITRPGGWGFHQVDFRDHRDFSRPLEYLLHREDEFRKIFHQSHGECGNRWRPDEMNATIEKAGFLVVDFVGNVFSTSEYIDDLMPRLRTAAYSRYKDRAAESLRVISGFYSLRKPE